MSTPSANLPLVIQQAGDVGRMQEIAQRAGEVQQTSAAAEVANQRERERTGISRTEASAADNRIRTDVEERKRHRQRREAKKKAKQAGDKKVSPPDDGGVVDVIV